MTMSSNHVAASTAGGKISKEMVGACCVCADENGWDQNPLVYCDGPGCAVAVHQGCYGIVSVPEGAWYCARCSASASDAQCMLCPKMNGALKRTQRGQWAHVVCALYIPEVEFGDVHSMDPVKTDRMPDFRYNQSCCLCEVDNPSKATTGACMQCNKQGCKKYFHVTCAQKHQLLREEGVGTQNVKYCGYCSQHSTNNATAYARTNGTTDDRCVNSASNPATVVNAVGDSSSLRQLSASVDLIKPTTNGPLRPTSNAASVSTPPASGGEMFQFATGGVGAQANNSGVVNYSAMTTPPSNSSADLPASTTTSAAPSTSSTINAVIAGAGTSSVASITGNAGGVPMQMAFGVNKPAKRGRPPGSTANREKPSLSGGSDVGGGFDAPKKARKHNKRTVKTLLELVDPVVQDTVSDFQRERVAAQAAANAHPCSSTPTSTAFNSASSLAAFNFGGATDGTALPGFSALSGLTAVDSLQHQLPPFTGGAPLKPTPKLGGLMSPPDAIPSTSNAVVGGGPAGAGTYPASLEQLLERQWEMGSSFLMEQAQHFDIASLLSLLHQLKQENQRIESEMRDLTQRRDHLLAVNARLTMTLGTTSTSLTNQQSPMASPARAPLDHSLIAGAASLVSPSNSSRQSGGSVANPMLPSFGIGAASTTNVNGGLFNGGRERSASTIKPDVSNFLMPRTTTPLIGSATALPPVSAQPPINPYYAGAQDTMMHAHQLQALMMQQQQQHLVANYLASTTKS